MLNLLEMSARGRLLAPQTGEPNLEWLERLHQRFDFAQLAALRRFLAIENPQFAFLLRDGLLRNRIYEIQVPFGGDLVAKLVGFGKVVTGFQEQNGNSWKMISQEVEHDHVFSLKAAGYAGRRRLPHFRDGSDEVCRAVTVQGFEI